MNRSPLDVRFHLDFEVSGLIEASGGQLWAGDLPSYKKPRQPARVSLLPKAARALQNPVLISSAVMESRA